MYERLLEGWLDSASERSYQGPFCQVLAAQGYTVLHSTRHAPIEFGKDVIAVAPDGVPCAYQLKGNPGGRLTHAQFREISPQLFELATQAIVFPGCPVGPHRAYLVTNGNVDEEVQRAIDDMNRNFAERGLASRIEIIARGQLLDWFKQRADFWPSEIPELHHMFKLLASTGREQPPFELIHHLLMPILRLDQPDGEKTGAPEIRRRITSAAVILAVCMRAFSQRENHYAIMTAWVLYVTYATATCERYGHDATKLAGSSVAIAADSILRALLDLAEEARSREHHIEGNALTDVVVYRGRRTLLIGLLSALWLWCEREKAWPTPEVKDKVESFITRARNEIDLWGEGAIPQHLALYWHTRATDATTGPDVLLSALLQATTRIRKEAENHVTLLSPYYSLEDVRRHQLAILTRAILDPLEGDTPRAASFFGEALFHLLVRTGLKITCKQIWPDLTRIAHERFTPDAPWRFCLWRTEKGTAATRILASEEQWSNVVEQARCIGAPEVPAFLRERPTLLLLFTIVCPHRATPNVVRYLGRVFNQAWFVPEPVDDVPTQDSFAAVP